MAETIEDMKRRIESRSDRLPVHVAIIMDGNGRWAARRHKPRTYGHEAGVKAAKKVIRAAALIGIKYLTLFTFSSENWKRPRSEVAALMSLLSRAARNEVDELQRNDVKLITTGRVHGLPAAKQKAILKAVERTRHNRGLVLNLALNYGGRTEIIDAVRAIANGVRAGVIDPNHIDEDLFGEFLYTAELPDPDLLVRTSGEQRISNFLLWQTSYTELHIIDTLWPDFGQRELFEAVLDYQDRDRRFGKVSTKDGR